MIWIGLIAWTQGAAAGPFTAKTMQQEWSTQRVEREWTLPKGWFQLDLDAHHKSTKKFRNRDDKLQSHAEGVRWDASQFNVSIAHGFSDRTSLYLHIPIVRTHLRTADAAHLSTVGMGDANAGFWFQPWRKNQWAVAFQVNLKAPSGVEWPSADGFLTGTGLTNLTLNAHGRMRWLPAWSTKLSVGYTFKFPALVGYVVEDGGFGNGKLDAGNAIDIRLAQTLQLHDAVSIDVNTEVSFRGAYYMGAAGPSQSWDAPQYLYDPSYYFQVGTQLFIEPRDFLTMRIGASVQALGTDTRPFSTLGLEEFSPQPGWTLSIGSQIRW